MKDGDVLVCICAVYLHHLPQLLWQLSLPEGFTVPQLQHCVVSAVILLLPGCLALGVHLASPMADHALQAAGAYLNDAGLACIYARMLLAEGCNSAERNAMGMKRSFFLSEVVLAEAPAIISGTYVFYNQVPA
jgi:hypothetical protein